MAVEKYLIVLTIVGLVDAISYMLVTPSLIFYVLQNGGTRQQYGIIISAFSFSSFCTKPVLGWWSDQSGFRIPYLASATLALMGGAGYLLSSTLPKGPIAVGAILASRLLGGCGAANSSLGFAYVARSVPPTKQTSTNTLLGLCRVVGMAAGPGLNLLLSEIHCSVTETWELDSLNAVGIVLVLANLVSAVAIWTLFEEPETGTAADTADVTTPETTDKLVQDQRNMTSSSSSSTQSSPPSTFGALAAILSSMDTLVPLLCIYSFNACFALIETAFAPAAYDAMGWGPTQSSAALGLLVVMIGANMMTVMHLSKKGVAESDLMGGGLIASCASYLAMYFLWTHDSSAFWFCLPIFLASCSFPYLTATTRTMFTVAVSTKPALSEHKGFLQSVLSMMASIAGFTAPGFVATWILRSPEAVEASEDGRELSLYGLCAPALFALVLLGVVYLRVTGAVIDAKDMEATTETEIDEKEDSNSNTSSEETRSLTETSSLLPLEQQV